MKKFHIVGAFDRHNYGDILFPLIHSAIIKSATNTPTEINFYAITSADLTSQGGVVTQSIKALIQNSPGEDDVVIMSGGDILCVDWPTMAGHVCSPAIFFAIRAFRKIFGFRVANYLTKNALLQKNEFPYILSRVNLNSKVYYSCVGGSGFNSKKNQDHIGRVAAEIKQTDGISVRDLSVQQLLAKNGVEARLVPDSALVMSDIFPLEGLETREWKKNLRKTPGFSSTNYIVFQGAKSFISAKLEDISEQLFTISKTTGLSILLLPIGRATGHEDQVALERLYKLLGSMGIPSAIQDSAHVLDIMASIALSKSYIGTSLHGAITAYSFGHKVCGIATEKVKKLHNFVSTWMQEEDYHLANKTTFAEEFIYLIKDSYRIKNSEKLEKHKKAIYQELAIYRESQKT